MTQNSSYNSTPEELEKLRKEAKEYADEYAEADEIAWEAVSEAWAMLESLNTNWLCQLYSSLSNEIKSSWETFFPGIIEGMTFEHSFECQVAGGGSVGKFPSKIALFSETFAEFRYSEEDDSWQSTIRNIDDLFSIDLVFLLETEEINRIELCNWEWRTIPEDFLESADRFIFQRNDEEQ